MIRSGEQVYLEAMVERDGRDALLRSMRGLSVEAIKEAHAQFARAVTITAEQFAPAFRQLVELCRGLEGRS